MVAAVALDPHEIVSDVAGRAHRPSPDDPPRLLRHPPGADAPLAPVHQGDEIAAVHRDWARAHADEQDRPAGGGDGLLGGALARARARAASVAAEAVLPAQQADRALIGDLVRVVDTLARRVDDIGDRLVALEQLVEELVVVTGEDLARIRAALLPGADRAERPSPPPDGPTDDE
jgi:hypothetical protein